MRISRLLVAVATVPIMIAGGTVAYADEVRNDIVDVPGETTITAGGSTTIGYYIQVQGAGADGQGGCNAGDGSAARVTLSVPSGVTASRSSLDFTGCGTANKQEVTFSSDVAGTYPIAVASVVDTGSGTYSNQANWTLTVNPRVVTPPPNTPPTVAVTGVVDGASYNKGAVPTAVCDVSDAEDTDEGATPQVGPVTGPYAADGIGSQTVTCSYTDDGGLSDSAAVTYQIVDPTAPTVGYTLSPATPDGTNGWYRSDVSLTWSVDEPESPSSLSKSGCVDQSITSDQASTSYSCSATSAGGSSGEVSAIVKRDATGPTNVSFVSGPADGGRYFPTTVPTGPTCTADDATSGLDSCVVDGYSTALGTHTLMATATDRAGNQVTVPGPTYTVRLLSLQGFFSPVDMGGVTNTVKAGSTVPLKFRVFDEGVEQKDIGIVKDLKAASASCSTGGEDAIEELASTNNLGLRYDATGGQFIWNWKTPSKAGSCYSVTMTTVDGSRVSALFRLK